MSTEKNPEEQEDLWVTVAERDDREVTLFRCDTCGLEFPNQAKADDHHHRRHEDPLADERLQGRIRPGR